MTQMSVLPIGQLGSPSLDALSQQLGVQWAEEVFPSKREEGSLAYTYQLKFSNTSSVEALVEAYRKHPDVEYAEPDYAKSHGPLIKEQDSSQRELWRWVQSLWPFSDKGKVPNDPMYGRQWALEKINAPQAWAKMKPKTTITVAIIDTGGNYKHEDLEKVVLRDKNGKLIGKNFVENNNDPMDRNDHGSHCGGICGAETNNGKGIAGTAWNAVKIMFVKGLSDTGSGYAEDLAKSIVWATDNGAKVLSLSWGSEYSSQTIQRAIQYAHGKGVLIFAAAGNSNTSRPHYPSGYKEVISVSATDQNDRRAPFSNYGKSEISAPGVAILSLLANGKYGSYSGTSMAGPEAACSTAFIWAHAPNLTGKQVFEIVQKHGTKLQTDKPIGPRINLEAALQEAIKAEAYLKKLGMNTQD